ncbi:aliphatic sulfonate ABC transporter substrate-binding protein [Methyloferula stellata]|uniref:aliphatic sulfonate ABC transporter substrate-binding protein n=1 Tax=Methyloferula stellata TaxID=876270 RepID=UPI000376B122|nr:aliphatic sulfonate ABC transporter substrate-binding protein [Methyloferula stellata]
MQRRQALQLILSSLAGVLAKAATPAFAGEVNEIRIGYQKSGLLPVLKQRQTLDAVFKPQGIAIKWVEFSFGPPILEGINTGNLDFGYTGDAPPVFAQAASANLVYAATLPGNSANGILVKDAAPLKRLADLKGKRVGFGKASSAHTTVLYALDKAGLSYSDIEPVYLSPPDGVAAFARGSIDAWAIWDPYYAISQGSGARVLADGNEVHTPQSFFLANKAFAANHGDLLAKLLNAIAIDLAWADTHRDAVAQTNYEVSGTDLEALRKAVARTQYTIQPFSAADAESQQDIANRFLKIGLLPKPVDVRDIVWKWTPAT